jgi:hypothetical protein
LSTTCRRGADASTRPAQGTRSRGQSASTQVQRKEWVRCNRRNWCEHSGMKCSVTGASQRNTCERSGVPAKSTASRPSAAQTSYFRPARVLSQQTRRPPTRQGPAVVVRLQLWRERLALPQKGGLYTCRGEHGASHGACMRV